MQSGTAVPSNYVSDQKLPNYIDSAIKGITLGSQLAGLPRQGAENVTQKAYAEIAKEQAKAVQDAIKQIQKTTYDNDPLQNTLKQNQAIQRVIAQGGIIYGTGGGGENPQVPVGIYGKNSYLMGDAPPVRPNNSNAPITNGVTPRQQNAPAPSAPITPTAPAPESPLDKRRRELTGETSFNDLESPTSSWPLAPIAPNDQTQYQTALQGGYLPVAPIA